MTKRSGEGRESRAAGDRRVFLVDGSGLIYRAHFAFVNRPLTTSRGMNVGALLGFINTLLLLIRRESARSMAVALDSPGPTFRHVQYEGYKANRPEMPLDLSEQIPYVERIVQALGLRGFAVPGVEADDIIGALARHAATAGWDVVIVSADKDFAQLLGPRVRQFVPSRGREPEQWLDADAIEGRYGVRPEQFIDFLALTGDTSDNIPGVAGIGPKTAAALLREFGSLDSIYKNLDRVAPPSARARLERDRANALLSRELVVIGTPAGFDIDPGELRVPDPSRRGPFRTLLEELEFRQTERRVFGGEAVRPDADPAPPAQLELTPADPAVGEPDRSLSPPVVIGDGWARDYRLATEAGELAAAVASYKPEFGPLAFDTETSSRDARTADLVGISFGWRPGEAWYVPLAHESGSNVSLSALATTLGRLLEDPGIEKAGQNLAFDLQALRAAGLDVRGPLRDTMVASYLRDPEARHGLGELAREWLGHAMLPITQLIGSGRSRISMAAVKPGDAALYSCEDVDAVIRLWPLLRARLEQIQAWRLFADVEMRLVPVLVDMEQAGIEVDARLLAGLRESFQAELERAEHEIHRLAGREFNINSPRQLQAVLFEETGLRTRTRTKTGFSTSQDVLETLAIDHPLPRAILEYRRLSKLLGTYVEALPRLIDPRTGRIHASFHQVVTATGRLSSSQPNLQNIPIRSERGREIRRAFVAPPGFVLISADYSQIELRILAHLADDPDLCAAFRAGRDIHRATAARIFGVGEDAVDGTMRARAKMVNFGVLYGMGAQRLARELSISLRDASSFIADYYAKLPGVKRWLDRAVADARERGYAETLLGRRRMLPALHSPNAGERSAAERMAVNTPIQGTAADLIKVAMVRLHTRLRADHSRARLLLQVHDELLLEAPSEDAHTVAEVLRAEMSAVMEMRVPLVVETGSGESWFDAHA